MNEKEFIKRVITMNAPDIDKVRENCIRQLNENDSSKKKSVAGRMAVAVAVLSFAVFLFAVPLNSFAKSIIGQIKAIINLNDNEVELGNTESINFVVPKDCESVELEGKTYLVKAYNDLDTLQNETGLELFKWKDCDNFIDNGVMLNIIENGYGRVALMYDVGGADTLYATPDFVNMFVYFPLSEDTQFGDLMLNNEQMRYSTFDDEGNVTDYAQNTEYELVEQYESKALNTRVTVIAATTDIDSSNEDKNTKNTTYYAYFTLDGMCYQVNCLGSLETVHTLIESISKGKASDEEKVLSALKGGDLLFRDVEGEKLSLDVGQTITISALQDRTFQNVFIINLDKNTVEKIGTLDNKTSYTFTAQSIGTYVIYDVDEEKNITDSVRISYSCGENEGKAVLVG
ncbi:MAG: hypothetical protein IJM37_00600 [Lachnospiraceae bacterium]|nr:hypothetical protein [Lachnospiraceae bacterium]